MELLSSYSLQTASSHLGISEDLMLKLITDGSLSIAVEISELSFGYTSLSTGERTGSCDLTLGFEEDEESTAYGYIVLSRLSRYSNFNKRFKVADRVLLKDLDVFSKYPSGHKEGYSYEHFYRINPCINKSLPEQLWNETYSLSTYITRDALMCSPFTRHLLENPTRKTSSENQQTQTVKAIEEFSNTQQIMAAAKVIRAIEEILLGRDYVQPKTGFYAETLRKVLIEAFGDISKIPKEPTLNKRLELERVRRGLKGFSLPRDSLRNMLAHIEQKTN